MAKVQAESRGYIALLYGLGLLLLAVVFLSPDAGRADGQSFFAIAKASPWEKWGDWPAAWCSVKICLLSLGVFLILAAIAVFVSSLERRALAKVILCSGSVASLGFWLGLFYLVKAVF
jgi:hypothetical protein